jgi:hypothetical protein
VFHDVEAVRSGAAADMSELSFRQRSNAFASFAFVPSTIRCPILGLFIDQTSYYESSAYE